MSRRNMGKRLKALEEKVSAALLTEESAWRADALLRGIKPLLCPVCLAGWQDLDQLPDNERWQFSGNTFTAPPYVDRLIACPAKDSCRWRVVDYLEQIISHQERGSD